jgi:DNA modification methylase
VKPYYEDAYVTLYHGDCRDLLPGLGRCDLLLTDPPYGIGRDGSRPSTGSHGGRKAYEFLCWDGAAPGAEVFRLMFAATDQQIIWGANYFPTHLPPSMGWLVWDKGQRIAGSDAEVAFGSWERALRVFTKNRVAIMQDGAVHPTQKPVALMQWCIAQADERSGAEVKSILDPFAGSGTALYAAKSMGRRAIGIEKEECYCEIVAQRCSQETLDLGA